MAQLVDKPDAAWAECQHAGLLVQDGPAWRFRHELARRVVESTLPAALITQLHTRLLRAMPQASVARRLHHASGAGLSHDVAALAPLAAAQAARLSAHREAALLYAMALACQAPSAPAPAQRAVLLAAHAEQCELIADFAAAQASRAEAITLHDQLGDQAGLGLALSLMSRLHLLMGAITEAKAPARRAIDVLQPLGPSSALAAACSVMAQLHLLDQSNDGVLLWGRRAVAMAELVNDQATLAHALNSVGAAELNSTDRPRSWQLLHRSLALAIAHGWPLQAARAFINLVAQTLVHRKVERWEALFDEALAYCDARDLELFATRLRLRRAYSWIEAGRWAEAGVALAQLASEPGSLAMDREQCEFLQAWLALRQRGLTSAASRRYCMDHLAGRRELRPQPWYCTPVLILAEAAWLLGQPEQLAALVQAALPTALVLGEPWRIGQLQVWLYRTERQTERRGGHQAVPLSALPGTPLPGPCMAELAGDLQAAAQAWLALRNPYQQAVCLLGGDAEQLRQALVIFQRLGAVPAAALARSRLRLLGEPHSVRGPNRSTRADPLGLTPRERGLLQDLALHLSDRMIAARLHRSPRTVEHQVATLPAKLGLSSRRQVADFVVSAGAQTAGAFGAESAAVLQAGL